MRIILCSHNPLFRHALGNVLGALGSKESLKIAREILFEQGPNFIDDYLFGAAQAITYDEKWHKQMMVSNV
ncbi:unnamed protein product [Strongylus vulgaris]|uniref:Uncharacterized protein n=1 Tax=Strongylus vulgaris TaxID=40348 RepID=A0A3P7KPK6_STRVU|nr:unnamed protein product [Strongylus vulgaris]